MFSKDVLLFLCQVSMVYVFDMPLIVLFSVRTFHFHILVGANCFGYAFFLFLFFSLCALVSGHALLELNCLNLFMVQCCLLFTFYSLLKNNGVKEKYLKGVWFHLWRANYFTDSHWFKFHCCGLTDNELWIHFGACWVTDVDMLDLPSLYSLAIWLEKYLAVCSPAMSFIKNNFHLFCWITLNKMCCKSYASICLMFMLADSSDKLALAGDVAVSCLKIVISSFPGMNDHFKKLSAMIFPLLLILPKVSSLCVSVSWFLKLHFTTKQALEIVLLMIFVFIAILLRHRRQI